MEICASDSGHAEVIQIEFDETTISFSELLLIFFKTHNPTTLNKQGNDRGTQYRSVVFYENEEQKAETEKIIAELTKQQIFDSAIVTGVCPVSEFYEAEDYHQNYFIENQDKPYCAFVIQPKFSKFLVDFKEKIKAELL